MVEDQQLPAPTNRLYLWLRQDELVEDQEEGEAVHPLPPTTQLEDKRISVFSSKVQLMNSLHLVSLVG